MPVTAESSNEGKQVTIAISGNFDFTVVQDFRKTYMDIDGSNTDITVDMRETEYMDSSALGMLLNMKKHIGETRDGIKIINCRPQVKKILDISRFDKKFTIA
ncbi:MAG: STAS domain-containing protein [Gammaproteobacteria bacterium]|nr:STAS domain-containing protein [Gammaproteobacteria bacterium]